VDPVAERQGVVLGLDAGLSTMEEECAKQGMDWEENLEQRAIEYHRMVKLGLPRPQWFGNEYTATQISAPQSPEQACCLSMSRIVAMGALCGCRPRRSPISITQKTERAFA
ncbi:hypothetical protein E3V34_04640, partial [Streptococcus pseudopneumoniae]|uniref:hypothetical protein n=1 Tax=Streptococcus pseudopneumoniae TaxID=257758 RepID=UPI001D31B993